jgi:hypothetical protein
VNRRLAAVLAMLLAACLASKLSLWGFRNKSYSAKISSYLPLFWSLGKSEDPDLQELGKAIGARLARAAPGETAPVGRNANVLLLVVESLRADAIDAEAAPFLDSLGRTGLVFKNHFSSANCTPYSLFSLLTGRWPSEYRSYLEAGGKPACFKMLPGSEFITGNPVSWSFWNQDQTLFRGFRQIDCRYPGSPQSSDSGMIENFFARIGLPRDRPFFGVLMLNSTHFGYTIDTGRIIRPGYSRDVFDMRTADPGSMPAIKDRYLNSVHLVDAMIRKAFRKLDSLGLAESTLVAVVGDHGEEFMETGKFTHSSEVNRYQTHVPLIIRFHDFRKKFTGYSSHVQVNSFLERLLSGGNAADAPHGIEASLAPAALAFNSVPLPDDADEFGAIGKDFEVRMRWNRSRLEAYDARFTGKRRALGPSELDAVAELIRGAGRAGFPPAL